MGSFTELLKGQQFDYVCRKDKPRVGLKNSAHQQCAPCLSEQNVHVVMNRLRMAHLVTCNLNSSNKQHACVLKDHFPCKWMLLPICDIVNGVHWLLVYPLEVNDAGARCWCQWKLYAVKWAVMSVFVNTCGLLPLRTATLHGTVRASSN